MAWASRARGIEDVFIDIFSYLSVKDLLNVALVCRSWDRIVFESERLASRIAINVIREKTWEDQKILKPKMLVSDRRAYGCVIVEPAREFNIDKVFRILQDLEFRYPIKGLRLHRKARAIMVGIMTPIRFCLLFKNLQSFDVRFMEGPPCDSSVWSDVIPNLKRIKHFSLMYARWQELRLAAAHFPELNSLSVVLTQDTYIDILKKFRQLENLKLMNLTENNFMMLTTTSIEMPNLKHLFVEVTPRSNRKNYSMFTIIAPSLKTLYTTSTVVDYVRIETESIVHTFSVYFKSELACLLSPDVLANIKFLSLQTYRITRADLFEWAEQYCLSVRRITFNWTERVYPFHFVVLYTNMPHLTHIYRDKDLFWVKPKRSKRRVSVSFPLNKLVEETSGIVGDFY